MKKIYILMCLVCAWSCVNSMDEPCELPIAGNWAGIDEDGAVLNYIEFKTGKYYEYASESKHYYSEKKIWHAKQSDFALQAESWYSVSGGKITFCGRTENISYTDNVLKIGDISYCPVDALDPEYGFTLTHQIPIDEQGVVQCSVAAHEIVWDCRISGLPDSARPDVELSESWVRLVSASEGQLRLQLDENTTSSQRSASVKLSHPAIVPLEFTLTQMIYGLSLSSNKTTTNYAGGSYEFSYSIENSYPEITAIAHSNKSWVTDVAINDGKVSFKVQENNSGQARSATIAVSYGTIVQLHTVEQSYEAATLTINNFYRTCSHLACERSFTYTITNPRSSYRLIVSCDAVWITDIKNEGGKITYKVSENKYTPERTATIVLKYGQLEQSTSITQKGHEDPTITCYPSSASMSADEQRHRSANISIRYPIEGKGHDDIFVSCNEDWIVDLTLEEGAASSDYLTAAIKYTVSANYTGAPRTAMIEVKYDTQTVYHEIYQLPYPVDLSANGTANCYVISKAGYYSFIPTKGNSTEPLNLSVVTTLWESFGNTTEKPAEGDVITDVWYKDDGRIYFSTGEFYRKGNAVIVADNENGIPVWSWHIWLTDDLKEEEYNNNAGVMMDRNLGATSSYPTAPQALGLVYQWGRKDPFLGAAGVTSNQASSSSGYPDYGDGPWVPGVEYTVSNPRVFLNTAGDWFGSDNTPENRLWTSSDKPKSIYDPCPYGWRVPDGGPNSIWNKAGPYMGTEMKYNYGRSLRIYGAGSDENKYYWYPFTGYKDCTTGEFKCVGEVAYYWTSYWEDRPYQSGYGSVLMLDAEDMSGDYQSPLFTTSACGFPVRCAKDTYK